MGQIVTIIGITHNPFMPRLFQQPQQPPGAVKVKERIEMMRQKLAEAKPDVLVTIGNDHLHQFFMDNMPAFMIGKMDAYDGTFYDEIREFGLPQCRLPGDLELSEAIMEGAFDRGVDFAYSNELTIEYANSGCRRAVFPGTSSCRRRSWRAPSIAASTSPTRTSSRSTIRSLSR